MKITPMPMVAAKGSHATDGGWLRIIKSLNACIVHVVGSHRASSRIHPGSKSSGHQQPPIAAIAMLMVTPNDITESFQKIAHRSVGEGSIWTIQTYGIDYSCSIPRDTRYELVVSFALN